jgi:hypothetical protein
MQALVRRIVAIRINTPSELSLLRCTDASQSFTHLPPKKVAVHVQVRGVFLKI